MTKTIIKLLKNCYTIYLLNSYLGQDTSSRISRKPNKPKRSNTATTSSAVTTASSARPNSRINERIRNGKSLENKRSPSDERKR